MKLKQFISFICIIFCCLLLSAPNTRAELVTAYTFEEGTELLDVAEMLGGGGVASDDLTSNGTYSVVTGHFGQGISVGLPDYLITQDTSDDLNPGSNGFTIALYTYGVITEPSSHIASKFLPGNGWYIAAESTIIGGFTSPDGTHPLYSDVSVLDNWHHIALTFDGVATAKLYVDGVLKDTRNDVTGFTGCDKRLHLGVASHAPLYVPHQYGGIYDDVAIFNEPLSQVDIERLASIGLESYMAHMATELNCVGFEPPMDRGPVKVKKNRSLPHKAQLFDTDGLPVTDADIAVPPVIQVLYYSGTGDAVDVTDDALPAGQGTEGNQFVFTEDEKWQFNLKTQNYTAPGMYTVTMESGDDLEYLINPKCESSFVIK